MYLFFNSSSSSSLSKHSVDLDTEECVGKTSQITKVCFVEDNFRTDPSKLFLILLYSYFAGFYLETLFALDLLT